MNRKTRAEISAKKRLGRELDDWEKQNIDRSNEFLRRRRLAGRTPDGIRWANARKRLGNMKFSISEDFTELTIRASASRDCDNFVMKVIGSLIGKATLWETKRGNIFVKVAVNPKVIREGLKLKEIPAECGRCAGKGEIPNPEERRTPEQNKELGITSYHWTPEVACPICRGTGRAPQLDSEAE